MNALEKLVDLLAACVLMFGIPLLFFYGKAELTRERTVERSCRLMLNQCAIEGRIDEAVLKEFEFELEKLGIADYDLYCLRTLPEYQNGEVTETSYTRTKHQILEICRREEKIILQKDDRIFLRVPLGDTEVCFSVNVRKGGQEI